MEDIRRLCEYAHRFGARIYVTFNTLVYEEEIPQARQLLQELQEAGVDALIVQDAAVTRLAPEGMILHASTQCAIRTPEKARFTESLGYGRLVLERELSLEQIRAIRDAVDAELEVFVHGALCVCYSGQCYLSEHLAGRSANRGACVQACRSLYDLEDGEGKVLARNKALLSLKDFNLIHRLEDAFPMSGTSSGPIPMPWTPWSAVTPTATAALPSERRGAASLPTSERPSTGITPNSSWTVSAAPGLRWTHQSRWESTSARSLLSGPVP